MKIPKFSDDEVSIVSNRRKFVKVKFFIIRYLKNYTVFLSAEKPQKAYCVLALTNAFEKMIGPYLPVAIEAVLLPFKDRIIYDGLFIKYSFPFGRSIYNGLYNDYQEAKSKYGIITSLPFSIKDSVQSDTDKLRFYLKSEYNRERYQSDIEQLISKDPDLLIVYHQEMGRIYARIILKTAGDRYK